MEPAEATAAFYGIETVVEGAAATAIAVAKPTMPIKASFRRIQTDTKLPRSSHSISIVKGRAYIFGGEEFPGKPVPNDMHIYTLPSSGVLTADYQVIPGTTSTPPSRIGHSASVVGDKIYIFGGKDGNSMLEENGRIWIFNTYDNSWTFLDPGPDSQVPEARVFHASTSSIHPIPTDAVKEMKIEAGTEFSLEDSERAKLAELSEFGTVFIHAGVTEQGRRKDIWSFDIAARFWSKLPDAPAAEREGSSLVLAKDRLYRFGGYDGEKLLGGQIDYLTLAKGTFDDKGGKGELAITLKSGKWESITFPTGTGPGDRSGTGLHVVTTGQGRNYVLCLMGERVSSREDESEGRGYYWDDVWSYQLRPEGMTAASFKDAARQVFGKETAEDTWAKVEFPGTHQRKESEKKKEKDLSEKTKELLGGLVSTKEREEEEEEVREHPGARGCFASGKGEDVDSGSVVLWGGIDDEGRRLGDGWILTVG